MESLGREQFKNISSFSNNENENINRSNKNNDKESPDSKTPEKLLHKLEKNVMFSENEKKLRKRYLRKYTKNEIFVRSIKLGKKNNFIKIIQYIIGIIKEVLFFKEADYHSELVKRLTNKDFENLMSLVYRYFLIIFINIIFHEVNYYLNSVLKDVSKQNILLENLLKKDMEFYDVFKTGELVDKCNYYGSFPYYDVIGAFLNFIKNIGTLLYSGYYLYNNFLSMGLISLFFFFLKMFVNPYINNRVNISEYEERYNLKNDILNEIFSSIRLIKSFGTEKKELKKLYEVSSQIRKESLTIGFLNNMYSHLETINLSCMSYILVKKCISGELEYGDIIIFEKYINEFKDSLNFLINIISHTLYGILEWRKFLEFYDIKPKIFSKDNAVIPKNDKEKGGLDIEFKNVNFSYPTKSDVQIFKDLSFKIPSGKIVAFVGYSGSGKTTITSLIQRFYDPNSGEILINGINLKDIKLEWLRENIGIVSQEPLLKSSSIKENIMYGVDEDSVKEKDFISACERSKVSEFVENKKLFPLGYETICGERGAVLSGGQKQRIAIARALIKDSKILIFDEATSALDAENESIVQNSINDIVKEKKVTTIIIAHRLSTIKSADCIFVINKGGICEFGTHKELMEKKGIYQQLIQNQIGF